MKRLRWNCDAQGCFRQQGVADIEQFDDCFGGKICFTDIDGIVERNGFFLLAEWKEGSTKLPIGQQILFEQLTKQSERFIVVVIHGHLSQEKGSQPETLTVFYKGREQAPIDTSHAGLRIFFKRWYQWADNQGDFEWHT